MRNQLPASPKRRYKLIAMLADGEDERSLEEIVAAKLAADECLYWLVEDGAGLLIAGGTFWSRLE